MKSEGKNNLYEFVIILCVRNPIEMLLKRTENTIEIKWGIPDDNGSKILYYTLYACKEEGGSFVNAYRGEKNKFKLGTEPKKKSGKKSFANKFKDKKNGSETDSDDDDGEEKSVPVIV